MTLSVVRDSSWGARSVTRIQRSAGTAGNGLCEPRSRESQGLPEGARRCSGTLCR